MANIGDQLLQPEEGWKRIDDNDSMIKYTGNWTIDSNKPNYNGNARWCTSKCSIKFNFYGSKLRIISHINSDHSKDITIKIDGTSYIYSEYGESLIRCALVYEKLNMEKGLHSLEISKDDSSYIALDAIDIDEDGYMIAQVGQQLTTPDVGWQRIDSSYSKIRYIGSWTEYSNSSQYGGTCYYTGDKNSYISFVFYGTKIRILSIRDNQRPKCNKIEIDDVVESYSAYDSTLLFQVINYEKQGLDKGYHNVKIYIDQESSGYLDLDAIDIDEDGYLIAQVGDQLLQPEAGWQRIDDSDSKIKYTGSWTTASNNVYHNGTVHHLASTLSSDEIKNSLINFRFFGSKIRIIAQQYTDYSNDIKIKIDGEEFKFSENGTSIVQLLVFEKLDLEEKVHEVEMYSFDGVRWQLDAIDIDESGCLLTEEEYESMLNKHLIKSNGNFYTIEENNLVEITEEITSDLIKERGISVNILTANQSLLPDKFKLVSRKDNTFNINAIKSQKELIVASDSFNTTVQSNIDFFDVIRITDTGTSIKVAFSIDNGATWKTYDTQFKDLSITIPNKPYEELTQEELVQWNNARDIISEQGIDTSNLSNIDFNTLNMEKIRFAYVLSINSKDDKCCTSQLKWQFDSKGTMKSMTSDELEIELLQDSIKVTPKISSDMIKINFSNGSTIDMTNQDNIKSLIENMSEENLNRLKEKLGI